MGMPETRVPMTLRDHFLQDPFFKSAWEDMEAFRGGFRRDSQSSKMIESSEKKEERKEEKDSRIGMFGRYLVPRKWMMPSLLDGEESLKLSDSGVINRVDDDTKLELSLNTAGYKPSELSVNVTDDPFFKDNWLDIQQSQRDFFSKAEERFSQQMEMLKSTMFDQDFGFSSIGNSNQDLP